MASSMKTRSSSRVNDGRSERKERPGVGHMEASISKPGSQSELDSVRAPIPKQRRSKRPTTLRRPAHTRLKQGAAPLNAGSEPEKQGTAGDGKNLRQRAPTFAKSCGTLPYRSSQTKTVGARQKTKVMGRQLMGGGRRRQLMGLPKIAPGAGAGAGLEAHVRGASKKTMDLILAELPAQSELIPEIPYYGEDVLNAAAGLLLLGSNKEQPALLNEVPAPLPVIPRYLDEEPKLITYTRRVKKINISGGEK